ncbi:MAG: GTP 3',8-cyclase MoaA [Lachnospiraceae bacterium]|nr:GTP 3',8-cyclase MoaA [Lachnospiraceae bacterium]
MKDLYQREIDYMRISITDRCNLRCKYCMPDDISLLSHNDILRYEEIIMVCKVAAQRGIRHLKITGGEPLVRKGCTDLIRGLKQIPGIEHVTITTNGVLLKEALPALRDAKIDGINVSLDTLDSGMYEKMTGKDVFSKVWDGLMEAIRMGFRVKINCVPIQGYNEDSLIPLVNLAKDYPVDVRFIELMPIGYGRQFGAVSGDEILKQILLFYPDLEKSEEKKGFGPASYYTSPSLKGSIGFIEAVHHKFCSRCNRIRLTADGYLKTCLSYKDGIDLKKPIREGASEEEIGILMEAALRKKPKEHHFGQMEDQMENRRMSQIGG